VNYERLTAIKAKYDPGNLFRHNQNIKPTAWREPAPWGWGVDLASRAPQRRTTAS
jgi:Berberine and berberine like